MKESVKKILDELIERYPVLGGQKENIEKAYDIMKKSFQNGGKLLIGGNGGSAADSGHIVGELMKGFVKKRRIPDEFRERLKEMDPENADFLSLALQGALPAIDITGHTPLNSAFSNDVKDGGTAAMAQQVYGYGRKGDVFLGITTQGNSKNVLLALSVAKAIKMSTIALTGGDGGKIKGRADVSIIVPENETFKIQELHLPVYHALCLMLEETFYID